MSPSVPPRYSVGPKPPKKSFKFQLKHGEDVDPMGKFEAIIEIFGQANLVTESTEFIKNTVFDIQLKFLDVT